MANQTTADVRNDRRSYLDIDTAKTLADTDCGIVQNVIKTLTITLPSTVVGYCFTIRNGGTLITTGGPKGAKGDGGATVTVAPASVDKIAGLGFTATDNKAAINTTGNIGDELTLIGDGVNGWMVVSSKGTWTRAA